MKKPTKPKAFNIYFDTFQHVEMLTMEQRGELFTALYEDAVNERITEFNNGMVKMAFSFFKAQIKRDFEKYYEKCEKLRQNALKRYEKDNDTKYEEINKENFSFNREGKDTERNNENLNNNNEKENEIIKKEEEKSNKDIDDINIYLNEDAFIKNDHKFCIISISQCFHSFQ